MATAAGRGLGAGAAAWLVAGAGVAETSAVAVPAGRVALASDALLAAGAVEADGSRPVKWAVAARAAMVVAVAATTIIGCVA